MATTAKKEALEEELERLEETKEYLVSDLAYERYLFILKELRGDNR